MQCIELSKAPLETAQFAQNAVSYYPLFSSKHAFDFHDVTYSLAIAVRYAAATASRFAVAAISVACAIAARSFAGELANQMQPSTEAVEMTQSAPNENGLVDAGNEPPPRFQLRGRLDTDAFATSQSAANEAIFGDLGEVVGVRRAWIGAEGNFASDSRYVGLIDLASGNVVIRDLFLGLGQVQEGGEFRAGHYLEPFSLELGTASYAFPFLECSAASILDPARDWGLSLFRSNPDSSTNFALGVFQAGTDPNDLRAGAGSTVGFTGRWTAALIKAESGRQLLHLGVAASERLPEHGSIIVSQQPHSPLLGLGDVGASPFLPTIRIPAAFEQKLNLQFAAASGPCWTQAEWNADWIVQESGGPVFFHGYHVDCGCFLTGENRPYQQTSGTFGAVRVERPLIRCHANRDRPLGWGAWELTGRFAYLDLQDSNTPAGPAGQALGMRLPQSTLGVNWYLADHVRLMFNYSYALPDEQNTGTSVANIFSTRLGVYW